MILTKTKVGPFRSITTPQEVAVESKVTVLVGMNEAGKTVFLKALNKALDATDIDEFDPVEDFPRKDLAAYMKRHDSNPEPAVVLTYKPTKTEIAAINSELHTALPPDFEFAVTHNYKNVRTITCNVDEAPVIAALAATPGLSTDAAASIKKAKKLREAVELLEAVERTDADNAVLTGLKTRIDACKWESVVSNEVWTRLDKSVPKFVYFSDYDLLPGKLNLSDLATRVANAKADPPNARKHLQAKHQAVLALLRMADVDPAELAGNEGYEAMKAKIEAVSISLTDQILEFWKQNEDLEVEVDIKNDPADEAPYNSGPNLYLRIKNRRHRGVSTPFDQRSRGFIWFFSFLVWFDSVQHQLDPSGKLRNQSFVLLLDEPGLALHALAQADFLRYIDTLSGQHQVIYTTHSPFMVNSDRLNEVRVVEDKDKIGTTISENLSGSDSRTIFPLQAALGWTIAQNLFISKRNLLVEGPSELAYLQCMSAILEGLGKSGLRDDVTIVPVGGLGNVVTFVSLLGASGLKLAVLHDYNGKPDQKLEDLIHQKLLVQKLIFNASQFRDVAKLGQNSISTDVEDLLSPATYLEYFNRTYKAILGGVELKESDLPPGDRIVDRIERCLVAKSLKVRPSGGFNHYLVASTFATSPPASVDSDTVTRFSSLFDAVNNVLS